MQQQHPPRHVTGTLWWLPCLRSSPRSVFFHVLLIFQLLLLPTESCTLTKNTKRTQNLPHSLARRP